MYDVTKEEVFERWLLTSDTDLRTLDEWCEEKGKSNTTIRKISKNERVCNFLSKHQDSIMFLIGASISFTIAALINFSLR